MRAAISRDSSLGNNGSRTGSASSASHAVSRDGRCFPPAGCGPLRSHVQGQQSPPKKTKHGHVSVTRTLLFLHFRNQSEQSTALGVAKPKRKSEIRLVHSRATAALFQFRPSDCRESSKTPPRKLWLYLSSLFKRHLSSGTTITEITGTSGEYCLVGVQFAVSTRLARFITN